MNGIWIITKSKTILCQEVVLHTSGLKILFGACFSENAYIELTFKTEGIALKVKLEVDDAIMRGDRYYKLEGGYDVES